MKKISGHWIENDPNSQVGTSPQNRSTIVCTAELYSLPSQVWDAGSQAQSSTNCSGTSTARPVVTYQFDFSNDANKKAQHKPQNPWSFTGPTDPGR
jgi:hypothetical protein